MYVINCDTYSGTVSIIDAAAREKTGAFNNMSARRATGRTPPERERSPARQRALATQADSCVALYNQYGDRTNNF